MTHLKQLNLGSFGALTYQEQDNHQATSATARSGLIAVACALPFVALALVVVIVILAKNRRQEEREAHSMHKEAVASAAPTSSSAGSSGTLLTSTSSIVGRMSTWPASPAQHRRSRPPSPVASVAPSFKSILMRPKVYRMPGSSWTATDGPAAATKTHMRPRDPLGRPISVDEALEAGEGLLAPPPAPPPSMAAFGNQVPY